jgi:hypothetical protein
VSLPTLFANLLGLGATWPVTIEVAGEKVIATAFEENDRGMWYVSYAVPGEYESYRTKWIKPSPDQRQERFETKKR